jgi:site-specific DNA recombinase
MKKKAISYVRISTKDQSNFSLSGQSRYVTEYCAKQDIELLASFEDDGRSAKDFDRPDWKRLELFVKQNFAQVDYLIVAKYDRFSRNVSEALQMIEKLEKAYNIVIISVMEPIGLHPKSPFFFQFRTQMLVGAQTEWLVIQDRTRSGIHEANMRGRWVNAAPIGYVNARDERNKPILEVNETKAFYIKEVFRLFLAGFSVEALRRHLKDRGFEIRGNSGVQRILANPLYAGLIKVNAFYDEPERLQKGIHSALISEAEWWRAQALLRGNKGKSHLVINEDVPLRGSLLCFCSKQLTAGNSRSKSGKYHWYYSCNNKEHKRYNYNAVKIHGQFDEICKELTLEPRHIKYMENQAVSRIIETMQEQYDELHINEQKIRDLHRKMENLEEDRNNRVYDIEKYLKWKERYEGEMEILLEAVESLKDPLEKRIQKAQDRYCSLGDLSYLFNKAKVPQKHSFIRWVFDNKLYYQDSIYRTPYIHRIFSSKAASLKGKRLLLVEQPHQKSVLFSVGSRYGNRTRLCPVKGGCPNR